MLETSEAIEPVYPAATVVLVRDSEVGLEALLVQRNQAVKHMGGMWVFPGGKVDEEDYPQDRDEYQAAVNAAFRETRLHPKAIFCWEGRRNCISEKLLVPLVIRCSS